MSPPCEHISDDVHSTRSHLNRFVGLGEDPQVLAIRAPELFGVRITESCAREGKLTRAYSSSRLRIPTSSKASREDEHRVRCCLLSRLHCEESCNATVVSFVSTCLQNRLIAWTDYIWVYNKPSRYVDDLCLSVFAPAPSGAPSISSCPPTQREKGRGLPWWKISGLRFRSSALNCVSEIPGGRLNCCDGPARSNVRPRQVSPSPAASPETAAYARLAEQGACLAACLRHASRRNRPAREPRAAPSPSGRP